MRLAALLGPVLWAAALATPACADDTPPEPSAAVLGRVAPSVLRVVAQDCTGDEPARAGSGFAWPTPNQVVTDLHVVIGCKTISVGYQEIDDRPAHVTRVLLAADLALLTVDHPPTVPALPVATTLPPVGATVDVFGFALGQPTRDTHPLRLTFANQEAPKLADVLPDAERADIRQVGFPALETEVLRLDGNLLPGHSGAPLINADGAVVGIGSGGLERGAVGVGWAIRAQYLPLLQQSADTPPAGTGIAATAFATSAPSTGAADSVRCGAMTLTRRRTLPLQQIAATADDPQALARLSEDLVEVKLDAIADNRFSIWTEPNSGAGVVVPYGLALEPGQDACIIHSLAGTVRYLVRLTPLPADRADPAWGRTVHTEEKKSFALIAQAAGAPLKGDRGGPFQAREWHLGALVRQRIFTGTDSQGRSVQVYRSDMAGRGAYILAAVINSNAEPPPDQRPRARMAWARGVFAINLSGFPPVPATEATPAPP